MRLRKHQSDLTAEDFAKYPIWLSIRDTYTRESDERKTDTRITMTPYTEAYDPARPLLMALNCMIAAELTMADGEVYPGYLKAKGLGMADVMHTHPTLFTDGGQIDFYSGIVEPTDEEIDQKYTVLGKTAEQIFPLHYKSNVLLRYDIKAPAGSKTLTQRQADALPFEGNIEGFSYLSDTGSSGAIPDRFMFKR